MLNKSQVENPVININFLLTSWPPFVSEWNFDTSANLCRKMSMRFVFSGHMYVQGEFLITILKLDLDFLSEQLPHLKWTF